MPVTTRSKNKLATAQPLISAEAEADQNENSSHRRGRKRKHDDGYENDNEHDDNNNDNDNPNPLLNDLVLENIFKHVQKKALLASRLVCRKWNILSLPFIRSKICIEIVRTGSPSTSGQTRRVVNFMKLVRSNTLGIPFHKFSLGSFDTTKGAGRQFIQVCGSTTKQIILTDHHDIQNVSNLLRSSQNLVSFTMPEYMDSKEGKIVRLFDNTNQKPTLSFLKFLDVGNEFPSKRRKICPTFYEELFETAPKISTLCLNTELRTGPDSSLEVLETIIKLGKEKSIENLTLPYVTRSHLNLFQSVSTSATQWNLKQLELTYGFIQGGTTEFCGFQLIKLLQNTLVALRINCNHGFRGPQNVAVVTFVDPMPKLRFLQLRLKWNVSLRCESFNSIFPALEKIDIDFDITNYHRNQSLNNILVVDEPCSIPTLKSSTIRCLPIIMERLERIITIFPTLNVLKCMVTVRDGVELIRNILTRMTQLEELHLSGEIAAIVNIDELITGIRAYDIKSRTINCSYGMEWFFKSLEPLNVEDRRERISEARNIHSTHCMSNLPSIGNLTNLRSLRLKLSGGWKDMFLTDVSGYLALYSLKNLQHLSLSKCELSESCAQILVKDKNLLTWKFKSTDDVEIIPTSCWRHKITDNQDQDKFPLLNL